ncbi:MAG: 3'-5' exoribonuclease YhaM family protein [Thermomicrobiales bacterium]
MVQVLRFADLEAGITVSGHVRVLAGELAPTRNGGHFHRLRLADRAGVEITARRFGCGSVPPAAGTVVSVTGLAEAFQGTLSLKLSTCVEDPSVPLADFLPHVPENRRVTLDDFDALVASIANASLEAVVRSCFPSDVRRRFTLAPAAVRHHGAAVGGLLAHTVRVARIAQALVELVPSVDRDMVCAVALLHDLGKLEELLPEPGAGLSQRGMLVGHVTLGVMAVGEAIKTVPEFPSERADLLLHAIIAAHGRLEYGAPVVPATLEALIVHLADQAEATIEAGLEAIERGAPGAAWTVYLPSFGTRLRVPAATGERVAG